MKPWEELVKEEASMWSLRNMAGKEPRIWELFLCKASCFKGCVPSTARILVQLHLLPVPLTWMPATHLIHSYDAELGSNRNPRQGLLVSLSLPDLSCHSL